jgi:putative ABC transport system permease protein
MIRNYFKTAIRYLIRFKGYTLINILGLAIGMACVILIMMYVKAELSYDTFHENKDRVYRINFQTTNPQTGEVNERAIGPYRLADELKVDFPDLTGIIRFAPQGREMVEFEDQQYIEEGLVFADPEVFQMFTFPLSVGDPEKVLEDPYSLVITERVAEKYFGPEDPIGKTLTIRDNDFAVTGILNEIPPLSQFRYDIMVSMNCAQQVFSRIVLENWGEGSCNTFVMVPDEKEPADYETRFAGFIEEKLEAWQPFSPKLIMQPLPEIYLNSKEISEFEKGGDITYVYAFSFIALFILIIACINFMNLATARSTLRAKEVGLRKVVGSNRVQLISQFLFESTTLALISLLIAVGLVWAIIPYFRGLAGQQITVSNILNLPIILGLIAITLFVGIAAGSYPALLLSGYKPVQVLAGKIQRGMKGGSLRKILVTFQFGISILLLIITGIVYKQLEYCRNVALGYDKNQLIQMGTTLSMRGQYDQFQAELLSNPQIINAGASSRVPPGRLSSSLRARPEGVPEDEQRGMQTVWTDFDFIETMGFEMASGRSFSRVYPSDGREGFILNEAAVREIGWTNETALGKSFGSSEITDWESGQWQERDGRVIGVLRDVHFESLKEKIIPTVYFVAPYMAWNYVIRIESDRIPETIRFIKEKWQQFNPEVPFEYNFVDENFAELYRNEERQGKIFATFALLAIFIACLGLVGLASFTAEQKKKEVGIRKVLGASSVNLVMLLSKEITLLVILAFFIAAPVSWYIMTGWLQDFAYRVPIGMTIFLISGALTLLIAWFTVGYQTTKTAFRNPVESLRYE